VSAARAAAVSSRVAAARAQVQQSVSTVARSASVNALRERMQAGRLSSESLTRSQAAIRVQTSPALQNFGNQVVDKVGSQNPLLAENKIVPREPERDALLPPPSEMTQSFDAVPSLRSSSTKQKVRHSKSVTLQEETMEAVNFLNLINLRLLP
jgi:hypothetical protein